MQTSNPPLKMIFTFHSLQFGMTSYTMNNSITIVYASYKVESKATCEYPNTGFGNWDMKAVLSGFYENSQEEISIPTPTLEVKKHGHIICSHGKQSHICKECGGSSICIHGKQMNLCKECKGRSICIHDKQHSLCRECGGSGICSHERFRSVCKDCKGSSVCSHDKQKYACKICMPETCKWCYNIYSRSSMHKHRVVCKSKP